MNIETDQKTKAGIQAGCLHSQTIVVLGLDEDNGDLRSREFPSLPSSCGVVCICLNVQPLLHIWTSPPPLHQDLEIIPPSPKAQRQFAAQRL